MKKIFLCCVFFLAACKLFGQDREAILTVLDKQQNAWNKGDIEGFMQGYWKSDSLLFVGSIAPTYGWQAALDHYKAKYPGRAAMGKLTFTIMKVNPIDKVNAFVLGAWRLDREKDTPGGYFTLWLRKIKGEWVIVCDHTS